MSNARSVFTESIEDHLALKKQNAAIEAAMPLARYDVGDPLDRYPGGPNRAADGETVVIADGVAATATAFDTGDAAGATQVFVGPSPEQAMEAATALEPAFADRPFEPLTGMAPLLSLVEDIDEDDDGAFASAAPIASAEVLRFPGGVGPREEQASFGADDQAQLSVDAPAFGSQPVGPAFDTPVDIAGELVHDAPTGEQPVLVIDTDEPLATSDWIEPAAPVRTRRTKPRFFGLGRKKGEPGKQGDGWFTDGPRDFNWD